jgi:hypothetical protein
VLEQLERALEIELVGRQVFGDGRTLLAALEVRTVATDADGHLRVVGSFALAAVERNRARVARVDVLLRELVKTGAISFTEVELLEVGNGVPVAGRDGVEVVLHPSREVEVDQIGEVLLQQLHHRERGEGGNQRVALLDHVFALLDGLDDRSIGRGPSDTAAL